MLLARISVRKLSFTARNTGLDSNSEYPELSTAWKAAHIKVVLWFLCLKAVEFANATKETFWHQGYMFS